MYLDNLGRFVSSTYKTYDSKVYAIPIVALCNSDEWYQLSSNG